jgi:hypothetical protein
MLCKCGNELTNVPDCLADACEWYCRTCAQRETDISKRPPKMKRCKDCGVGIEPWLTRCKPCKKAVDQARYERNRERQKEKRKQDVCSG